MSEQQNATGLMAQLMRDLKPEMNGAVTGAMEARGIVYPLNYGVSVPTIRSLAAKYAPNHKLATLLYRQQIRELILASITIADPNEVTADSAGFWADGISNIEVAEHIAQLIGQSNHCTEISEQFIADSRKNVIYAGLISLAKGFVLGKINNSDHIIEQTFNFTSSPDNSILRGVEMLYVAIGKKNPEGKSTICQLCNNFAHSNCNRQKLLSEEILWQIEI